MVSKNKYIGITIGPIFDTVNLTSSPAALWAASYMFSTLAKSICEILTESYGVLPEQIVSPFFDKQDPTLYKNDGVGLFHDRIIFRADNFPFDKVDELRENALQKIAYLFGLPVEYLREYLMISAVPFEAENPILESGQILDCLELAKPFVFAEKSNPILVLFTNTGSKDLPEEEQPKEGKNEAVKKLTSSFTTFSLRRKKAQADSVLKSLWDIVHVGKGYKKYRYYAIVRSDGDNMSKIISSLKNDKEINQFSKTCLEYCAEVAAAAENYGGVAIYAGGDDLLAILPCENADAQTPFHFIEKANGIFKTAFEEYNKTLEEHNKKCPETEKIPLATLSFGVTIAYYKFPLYEALADSANLLFGTAKSQKNCTAVRVQKHAGQSEGLVIANDALHRWLELLKKVSKEESDTLLSAMHKLDLFEISFEHADTYTTVENLFKNTFDAAAHADNSFVHEELPKIFYALKSNAENALKIYAINQDGVQMNDPVLTLHYMLRILKFYIEKEGGKYE